MAQAVTDASDAVVQGPAAEDRPARFGSLSSIIFLLVLAWTAGLATYPLNDNSFFTHLATGRIILDEGRVPSADPYTFTAQGDPWTVQSWLASVAYAGFERLGGDVGLRALVLGVFVAAATVLWRLTRPVPTVISRLLLVALALFVVSDLWGERPYMIGVIGIGLVWLALEGHLRPWLLVPLLWVWTNTHGSFPLAVLLCGAVVIGGVLDRRATRAPTSMPDHERRVCGAVALGIGLGAISPLGPKVLWFPLTALTKSGVFAEIIEWQAPTYRSVAERAFLALVVVTLLLLSHRPSWRLTLPAVGFAAMALYAQRNIVMATMVLVAVCALTIPPAGSLRSNDRPAFGGALAAVVAVLVLVAGWLCLTSPVDGFGGYPTRALAFVEATDLDGRAATEIPAGNLLGLLDGGTGKVFIDDRVDMFGADVFEGFLTLRRGSIGWGSVLDEYEIDLVVWGGGEPLAALLGSSPDWSVVYADTGWMVACRRSSCSG